MAFGVVFAPLATSFLDAFAVVITGWGRNYWPLSLERFSTNALAALTIVPPIVLWRSNPISWIRRASLARLGEAALLAIGVVLVAVVVFGLKAVSPATTPALLYVPLPFLLWAAARFGLGWTEHVSLVPRADLDVVHNARTRTVPECIHVAEHPVPTNLILCGRCTAHVPLGGHGRVATDPGVTA